MMLNLKTLLINWPFLSVSLAVILVIIALPRLINLLISLREIFLASDTQVVYQRIVAPDQDLLPSIILLSIADIILLITNYSVPKLQLIYLIELPIGLSVFLIIGWLGYRLVDRFSKIYLTEITETGQKLNKDLFIVGKWLTFLLFLFIVTAIFSQTHKINLFGLIASLGVGGVAIAFAAQKTLEQLLGGFVLYLDRPFVVSDYIGLPDGTFGKVESIGLRSSKIRISGRGTLMVVPNNYLTGINIENFTGASKLINIVKVNFFQLLSDSQKSFVSQLMINSGLTNEIDFRNLSIHFQDIINHQQKEITQAQVHFFMPLVGESSTEFRIQIIKIISENIRHKLLEYGMNHEIVEQIFVNSEISI